MNAAYLARLASEKVNEAVFHDRADLQLPSSADREFKAVVREMQGLIQNKPSLRLVQGSLNQKLVATVFNTQRYRHREITYGSLYPEHLHKTSSAPLVAIEEREEERQVGWMKKKFTVGVIHYLWRCF